MKYINYYSKYNYEDYKCYKKENNDIYDQPLNISGIWDARFGRLVLAQEGNKVTGYTNWQDGIVSGLMKGKKLIGNWGIKPTYTPPDYAGSLIFEFTESEYRGKLGLGTKPLYYATYGKKESSSFIGNCYRYRVINDMSSIERIIINDEMINYGQESSYFYPEECSRVLVLNMVISNEVLLRNIPVQPGYSYTIHVIVLEDIEIDVSIDNPFISE